MTKNVLGTALEDCCPETATGFFRNGRCDTCEEDVGLHTVCAVMTDDFLRFSKENGNDLITPKPNFGFPGLIAGDRWCICLARWIEACEAGMAPKILLRSTHHSVTKNVSLEILERYALHDS